MPTWLLLGDLASSCRLGFFLETWLLADLASCRFRLPLADSAPPCRHGLLWQTQLLLGESPSPHRLGFLADSASSCRFGVLLQIRANSGTLAGGCRWTEQATNGPEGAANGLEEAANGRSRIQIDEARYKSMEQATDGQKRL